MAHLQDAPENGDLWWMIRLRLLRFVEVWLWRRCRGGRRGGRGLPAPRWGGQRGGGAELGEWGGGNWARREMQVAW